MNYYEVNDQILDEVKKFKCLKRLDLTSCIILTPKKIAELVKELPLEFLNLSRFGNKDLSLVYEVAALSRTLKKIVLYQMKDIPPSIGENVEVITAPSPNCFEKIWPYAEIMN